MKRAGIIHKGEKTGEKTQKAALCGEVKLTKEHNLVYGDKLDTAISKITKHTHKNTKKKMWHTF
jgi:hypothetical protein